MDTDGGASQFFAVAERLGDGSRGLQPSDQAGAAVLRRGATLEPARLRRDICPSNRGLKPTATVIASLCEAGGAPSGC